VVISAARRTSPCNIISARARSGSSGLPCQQIGQRADRREPVVQGVEDVRGAVIHHHVADFGRCRARRRGWEGRRRSALGRTPLPAEQVAEQDADGAAEAERDTRVP